ncbi:Serine/threonine-protein kinase ULK3 [Oryzias melastigma]|uniref:Serine/threonine-protein kinase ULK3 n=1 Tax=Oryzias melastigma TaxID=30732 RepID=A0A834F664_ORYME|nr:Serine/threonine-protein kinase ULK3 [Oryzias melastigma]
MASTSGFAPPKLADFILTERLGSGTYATVYKAYRKGNSREVVAVKVVGKKTLNKASTENLLTEIEILKTVRHPHIVQLKDFQWDADNIYLILEWCSGGDLSRFIRSRRILPESVARRFLQQIACALQFLHERNISHLDLKPQNILLSGCVLKLADFGFAQYMSPWDEKSVLRGSPLYMAPEMVCRRQYDSRVDLWSVGVILYGERRHSHPIPPNMIYAPLQITRLCLDELQFASKSFAELEEKIRSDQPIELPPGAKVSKDCRDLLLRLLERNPDARITFAEFFTHPFVDMEHMPSADSIEKAKELVVQAVQKDQDGERSSALSLYCSSLEHFVPAIYYETDRQRKEALRQKVKQYVSRAEELKALLASDNKRSVEEARSARDVLREMSQDQPRVVAALNLASTAIAKEESRSDDCEALDMYQQCLGELLLALAAEPQGRRKELLHSEIKTLMARAEYLKKHIKMQETQQDVSLDRESFADSIRGSCCVQ